MKKVIFVMFAMLFFVNISAAKNIVIDLSYTNNQISMSDVNASNKVLDNSFPEFTSANAINLYLGYAIKPEIQVGGFMSYIGPSQVEFKIDYGSGTYDKYLEQVDAIFLGVGAKYLITLNKLNIVPNFNLGLIMVSFGVNSEDNLSGTVYKLTTEDYINYSGSAFGFNAGVNIKYALSEKIGLFLKVGYLSAKVNQSDMKADKDYTDSDGDVIVTSGETMNTSGTVDLSGLAIGAGISLNF